MMLSKELNEKLNLFLNEYHEKIYNKYCLLHEITNQTLELQEEIYIKGHLERENELLELFKKEDLLKKEILEDNKQKAINNWFEENVLIKKVDTEIGKFTITYENANETNTTNQEKKRVELEELIEKKKKSLSNEDFMKKAPKEIVDKEKRLLEQYEEEYKKL